MREPDTPYDSISLNEYDMNIEDSVLDSDWSNEAANGQDVLVSVDR